MNWSRAKTILIALFLIVDLFLLTTILTESDRISPEVISSTVEVLKNNGITIDRNIIPSKSQKTPYSEVENVITSYDEFAALLLGDSYTLSGDNSFSVGSKKVSFSGNSFIYESSISKDGISTDKNPQNVAAEFLKNIGFDLSGAEVSSQKSENSTAVTFYNYSNSLPVFNSSVTVSVSGEIVTSVSGMWFNTINTNEPDTALKSITSILIDTAADIKTGTHISSLELGYSLPDSTVFHKSAVLIPVWQITSKDGKQYFPDARNPE